MATDMIARGMALSALQNGGGGGSATNYNTLSNKPKIAGIELQGNKSLASLGIQPALTFDAAPTSGSSNPVTSGGVAAALSGKVDAEAGKGLSANNYTNMDKNKLSGIEAGAEVNVIIGLTVNGEPVVPVSRVVALNILTNTVNNLTNYYLKSETYTQEEVNALVNSISSLTMEIVDVLPTADISTTTIYLVPTGANNVYSQYAYINSDWALLGSTSVDLTNYYTKAQADALLAAKQDSLTFDTAPTSGSVNPVTSGGIFNALAAKQDALTFDAVPTENSVNPVMSCGVFDALSGKQDTLTFDTAPTAGSPNPVTSGGVAAALENVTVDVATETAAGVVKPDGTSVTVDPDGTLHAAAGVEFDERDFVEDSGTVALVDRQRIFTGTQAEWDALSTAEKKTYGVVNITDDESGTPEYYSTTETKTNKVWIDGKPIYRKVVWYFQNGSLADGVTQSGTFYATDKFPSDVDTLTDYVGMSERSDGFVDKCTSNIMVPNKTTKQLHFSTSESHVNAFVIYEYTKTTD